MSQIVAADAVGAFVQNGFVVAPSLFSPREVNHLCDHYMRLRAGRSFPRDFVAESPKPGDPIEAYPRMMHMHRWDPTSLQWLLDSRLKEWLTPLFGSAPLAAQSSLYFKPPGARGQALHQDQYYLMVRPGPCITAWFALDGCDEANGCLHVVPGSHALPLLKPEPADTEASITDVGVAVPHGMALVPVIMNPGDVLFFHGSLIHGSYPNTTRDRFRRSLVAHYISAEASEVAKHYHPVLRMDGSVAHLRVSTT